MKNINLIPAAALSAACVIAFSASAPCQALQRSVQVIKATEKSAAHLQKFRMINLPKTSKSVIYSPILREAPKINAVRASAPTPTVILPKEQTLRLVWKQQKEAAARATIQRQENRIRGVLLYRKEIITGYHLPAEYLEGFFLRRIFPYQQKPTYTPDGEENVLFRGMLVTPEELAQILKSGFSPATSKWNTGAKAPAVSLSSSSVEATHYIFQSGYKENGIGIVFKVRKKPSMELGESQTYNSTKTIYYSYEDVPAEDILDVLVRGEYGLESLDTILERAAKGEIKANSGWTSQFNGVLR